jgi:hypothetical protein
MKNKQKNISIYSYNLNLVLRHKIIKEIDRKRSFCDIQYHHLAMTGLVDTLARIIQYSNQKPKYFIVNDNQKRFGGYHIYSTDIQVLNRNKIAQRFTFFTRSDESTYHRNNSKQPEKNGYSHWYIYSDLIHSSIEVAMYLTMKQLKYHQKYQPHETKHKRIAISVKNNTKVAAPTNSSDLKISKYIFFSLYKQFKRGLCDDFLNLLYKSKRSDDRYVYIDNSVISSSLDGYGREYTTIGSLSKQTRHLILNGYTEVDVSTAIQSVLVNLFYMDTLVQFRKTILSTLPTDFPSHYELMVNKERYRKKICFAFTCDQRTAKELITSISYSPKRRYIYKFTKQRDYIATGSNYRHEVSFVPRQIVNCKKLIEPFIKETIKLRKSVLENFYYQKQDCNEFFKVGKIRVSEFKNMVDEEIRLQNRKIKGKGRGKSLDDRRVYRIYELIEHQIRTEMINYIDSLGYKDCYQLHDCIIFKGDLDIDSLENYIYLKLNMKIFFSKEVYGDQLSLGSAA